MSDKSWGSKSLIIDIELESIRPLNEMFRVDKIMVNDQAFLKKDVKSEVLTIDKSRGFDGVTFVTLSLSFGAGVASGIIANALYSAVGTVVKKIRIEGREVRLHDEYFAETIEKIIMDKTEDTESAS